MELRAGELSMKWKETKAAFLPLPMLVLGLGLGLAFLPLPMLVSAVLGGLLPRLLSRNSKHSCESCELRCLDSRQVCDDSGERYGTWYRRGGVCVWAPPCLEGDGSGDCGGGNRLIVAGGESGQRGGTAAGLFSRAVPSIAPIREPRSVLAMRACKASSAVAMVLTTRPDVSVVCILLAVDSTCLLNPLLRSWISCSKCWRSCISSTSFWITSACRLTISLLWRATVFRSCSNSFKSAVLSNTSDAEEEEVCDGASGGVRAALPGFAFGRGGVGVWLIAGFAFGRGGFGIGLTVPFNSQRKWKGKGDSPFGGGMARNGSEMACR